MGNFYNYMLDSKRKSLHFLMYENIDRGIDLRNVTHFIINYTGLLNYVWLFEA